MRDLDEVLACDRQELILRWRKSFGSSPPRHLSTLFLQKVLAHHLQCKTFGGLSKRSRAALKRALRRGIGGTNVAPPSALTKGVQLVREWNGRTWRVEVLEEGFACNGKTYRSLSAVARMITGTHWSGPRFFGVNR